MRSGHMLLSEFKVSSFKVFGPQVEFSMKPRTKNYQSLRENIIESGKKKVIKSTLFYGGNNTGKSSMLEAIMDFKTLVSKGTLEGFPFDLLKNFCYEDEDIKFEVSFIDEDKEITYGVEFNDSKKIGEYLFVDSDLYFSREKNGEVTGTLFKINKKISERIYDLPMDKLILTYVNEYVTNPETDLFQKVKTFFDKIELIKDVSKNQIVSKKILDFATNSLKMKLLNDLISSTELYMDKRELKDEEYVIKNSYYTRHLSNDSLERLSKIKNGIDGLRMVSYYKDKDGNSLALPSVLFDSIGTNKFIVLAMYIIDAILDKKILLIDEIDSSLHYRLTRALVILMNSTANRDSQFIMTSHDVKLLTPYLFRKDQLNFMIRDHESVTIVSLDDFKANTNNDIRSNTNFEKIYTEERIVDLPSTNISNIIKEINELWENKI